MKLKWDFWDFTREYLIKVLGLWFVILSAVSIVMYLLIRFWLEQDVSIAYWIVIVVVGVFIAQSVAYYKIARRQILGERIELYLENVSKLREEGVNKLQNKDVNSIKTPEDLKEFRKQFDEWQDQLILEVEKISPSQASIFRVLGTYQPVTSTGYQGNVGGEELKNILGIIIAYTTRIKDFVDRFSLENLANRVKE